MVLKACPKHGSRSMHRIHMQHANHSAVASASARTTAVFVAIPVASAVEVAPPAAQAVAVTVHTAGFAGCIQPHKPGLIDGSAAGLERTCQVRHTIPGTSRFIVRNCLNEWIDWHTCHRCSGHIAADSLSTSCSCSRRAGAAGLRDGGCSGLQHSAQRSTMLE